MTKDLRAVILFRQEKIISDTCNLMLYIDDLLEGFGSIELTAKKLREAKRKLEAEIAEINGLKIIKKENVWNPLQ